MKVLFVSSGNKKGGISPIVFSQGESLKHVGASVEYYSIDAKGIRGYLKHLIPLSKVIRKGNFDIIHAHYSLCGFLATLASPISSKMVVSLMGSFKAYTLKYYLIRILAKYRWKAVIVKSKRMQEQIGLQKPFLIPNGVQLSRFENQLNREELKAELNVSKNDKLVIFVSNPERPEKNYKLCEDIVKKLNDTNVKLIAVFNKTPSEVAEYMQIADVLMLTSLSEGSPNVIKEAMAACCPIVTTNVGDVEYLLEGLEGTYIMKTFNAEEGASLLRYALDFNKKTDGVNRLKKLGLTSEEVANRIINLYNL